MGFKVGDKVEVLDKDAIEGGHDLTNGKVYKITEIDEYGDISVIDDANDHLVILQRDFAGLKLVPSKNQRITELESQVANLLERVETLENGPKTMRDTLNEVLAEPSTDEIIEFEGNQYRKVDREAREGDVVIFKDTTSPYLTNGKPYLAQILDINTCVGSYQLAVASSKNINRSVYDTYYKRTHETVDVYERIEQPKSPNQSRAEVIEKAKKFVEVKKENYRGVIANGFGDEEEGTVKEFKDVYVLRNYYIDNRKYNVVCYVEFVVNPEKRTIVALMRGVKNKTIYKKGIAKCHPDNVFNEHIGKAIALGRALGLDVTEFEQAVQPTIAVGQVITHKKGSMPMYTVITLDKVDENLTYVSDEGENRNAVGGDLPNETWYTIINDTNAQYGGGE